MTTKSLLEASLEGSPDTTLSHPQNSIYYPRVITEPFPARLLCARYSGKCFTFINLFADAETEAQRG